MQSISQMNAFEEMCRAIRNKRERASALSDPEKTKIVGMIQQGRDIWTSMGEPFKDFAAYRYSSDAGVRRAIHAVPELHALFRTYQSPYALVPDSVGRFSFRCRSFWDKKVSCDFPAAHLEEISDEVCGMWEEFSEDQKDTVLNEYYFNDADFRRAIKEIPEVFEQFKQEKLFPLWRQVTRMRKDALVHLCLRDDYVLWSAQESEMIDFVGQHYELMLAEHDAAYWDRLWQ